MKQDDIVSLFLRVGVKKLAKSPSEKAQCEVFAVAAAPSGKKKNAFAIHKSVKDLSPIVERLVSAKEFSPKSGMCLVRFLETGVADHVLVVGTGADKKGINAVGGVERLRRLGASVAQKLAAEKIKNAIIHLDSFLLPAAKFGVDTATAAYAFAEGAGLASYSFKKYLSSGDKPESEAKKEEPLTLTLVSAEASRVSAMNKGVAQAQAMLAGAFVCRDLGNEPSNELTPVIFADRCKKLADAYGLKLTVLDEKMAAKEKMGLLLGVGQGSVHPPRLIMLEYTPKKKAKKTIALVGKGITFDSGGISIKPSTRMEDMKHDMCGAAAVVGAIVSASLLKLSTRIITVVASAENMPSGNAIQPGNILRARNGKTVEVINTDAEGRLVLADALDYVQDLKPDYIIDAATLTGAAQITLGKVCSGLMGNDDAFNRMIRLAARDTGERTWELPLFDEYFDDLKSEYADMRNSGDSPANGTAKGAMFLLQFIRKGTRWAHLDIAPVAYGMTIAPYYPRKSSSGYGVRLLVDLAQKVGK